MKKLVFISILALLLLTALVGCGDNSSDSPTQDQIKKHTHIYNDSTVEATCTSDGYTLHACDCGNNYKDDIKSALGHNYVEREQNYKCSRCNRYEDEGFTFELITSEMARYNDNYKDRINTYEIKTVSNKAVENSKVSLPKKHMGYAVTGIYKGALYTVRETAVELFIPSTIKYIGSSLMAYDGQFNRPTGNVALESIIFDNSCSNLNISHTAFQFCKKVSKISMTSNCIRMINHDDLVGNHFLFEDTLYYKSNRIENGGLYYLFNMLLESDKSKLASSVSIKSGTTIIANQVFSGNTNIKIIEIPSTVVYIGKKAFAQCVNLSTVNYNGTEAQFNSIIIEENAFQDCKTISYKYI